jgi:hypothetical protein
MVVLGGIFHLLLLVSFESIKVQILHEIRRPDRLVSSMDLW